MGTLWFWIVALMLAAYAVLDGFDLGVGMIYPFVAHTDRERTQAIHSIGPVWDGNEVWLLAASGTIFFAFPLLYASAFSGFYLPLMIVLWLLILRGVSIELRGQFSDPIWRTFFDGLFTVSSFFLTIFYGAALANVVRGVPIRTDGYFFLPLWTDWRTGANPGILDWYTVLGAALAITALSLHGALYLSLKTEAELEQRSLLVGRRVWVATVALTAVGIPATVIARPASLNNYKNHSLLFLIPLIAVASLFAIRIALSRSSRTASFLASSTYLLTMTVGSAAGLYPVLLPAVSTTGQDLTIDRAVSGPHTLEVGLIWWSIGISLALVYFGVVYWLFRGKVATDSEGYGH